MIIGALCFIALSNGIHEYTVNSGYISVITESVGYEKTGLYVNGGAISVIQTKEQILQKIKECNNE